MRCHVLKGDVSNVDEWLSLTSSKRVKHAARTSTTWLTLLLWTDVNTVPNWEVDIDILIPDIPNLTCSMAWICLDINSFHWIIKLNILESYSSNACMLTTWWY